MNYESNGYDPLSFSDFDGFGNNGFRIVELASGKLIAISYFNTGETSSTTELIAQFLDLDGQPLGDSFFLDTASADNPYNISIAAMPDGGFAVLYESENGRTDSTVYYQRFDADGAIVPMATPEEVGSGAVTFEYGYRIVSTDEAGHTMIAVADDGTIATSWVSFERVYTVEDGWHNVSNLNVKAYDPSGNLLAASSDAIVASGYIGGYNSAPQILSLGSQFLFVWLSEDYEIQTQIFGFGLQPVSDVFTIGVGANGYAPSFDVDVLEDGNLVFVWHSNDGPGTIVDYNSYMKILSPSGDVISDAALLDPVEGRENFPSVTAMPNGSFVVSWNADGYDDVTGQAIPSIIAQSYDADGTPNGDQFVASAPSVQEYNAELLGLSTGDLLVQYSLPIDGTTWVSQVLVSDNSAPVLDTPVPNRTFAEDGYFSMNLLANFSDPDGDPLTLTVTLADGSALPDWLSFNGSSLLVTTTNNFNGSLDIKVTASDGQLEASDEFNLLVTSVNDEPIIAFASDVAGQLDYYGQGFIISSFLNATNFSLVTETHIDSFSAITRDSVANGSFDNFSGTLSWAIYSNDGTDLPGELLVTGNDFSPELVLAATYSNLEYWQARVDIDTTLAAGDYWLALHEGEWGSPTDGSEIAWQIVQSPPEDSLRAYSSDETGASGFLSSAGPAAPAFTLTGAVPEAVEGVPLDLKGQISIGDVDIGTSIMTVTLAIGFGHLNVDAGTSGAAVSGSGSGEVTVTGTLDQVNALLGSDAASVVSYVAEGEALPEAVTLKVTADDGGATGVTSLITAVTATLPIAIEPAPDPEPTFHLVETFDDGILNGSPWSYAYDVTEADGYLKIVQSGVDLRSRGIFTQDIPLLDANFSWDGYYHPSDNASYAQYFYGPTRIFVTTADGERVQLRFSMQSTEYAPDYDSNPANYDLPQLTVYDPVDGTYSVYSTGLNTTAYLDDWTNFVFDLDSDTGTVTIDIEGDGNPELTVTEDFLVGAGLSQIMFESYGWWTGHYVYIDNFEISGTPSGVLIEGTEDIDRIFPNKTVPGQPLPTDGADLVYGYGGNDQIDPGAGADTMVGGTGSDKYWVDNIGDKIVELADEGTDKVYAEADFTLPDNVENLIQQGTGDIYGAGNDLGNLLTGNDGDNTLFGFGGADGIDGGAGADAMAGGEGNDRYIVDDIGDVVVEAADEGHDTVKSFISYVLPDNVEGLDLLGTADIDGTGNALDNSLTGNAGANTLVGGDGKDRLNGKGGADVMIGGLGNDRYYVDDPGDVVDETGGDGTLDRVYASIDYTLTDGVERLYLEGDALTGSGNGLDNVIVGNAEANVLYGLDGDDRINGRGGIDTAVGGIGNDSYFIDDSGDIIIEFSGEGYDVVFADASYVLSDHVEKLKLRGNGDLDGTGNDLDNDIDGTAGSNTLNGLGGADNLRAGAGDDFLFGGDGADFLTGSLGQDEMTGGADADRFIFKSIEESETALPDYILDFSQVDGDIISLSGIDADTAQGGNQRFDFIAEAAFTGGGASSAGELRYEYVDGDTMVSGDVDGDGNADFAIRLAGEIELTSGDFFL